MFRVSEEYFYKNIVKCDRAEIREIIYYKDLSYKTFFIPKKKGYRKIDGIESDSKLYIIQKNILENFLSKIELPLCVKGFIKKGSYINYLKKHTNKKYYLRMDIKHFFDSISREQILENLNEYIQNQWILNDVIEICTLHDKVPQGAITSPSISNIVFRRIDQRITKYCQKFNITYTRYADDLLFSSNEFDFKKQKWFYKKIKYILNSEGFESNYSKKHIESDKICLGGYVVEKDIHLSRKKLNNLNKILYYFKDINNTSRYTVNYNILNTNYISE